MKGVVFTEFLEMVEKTYGLETLDFVLEKSELKSEGIYTAIGDYEIDEFFTLLDNLVLKTKESKNEILYEYGGYICNYLEKNYSDLFKIFNEPLAMLAKLDEYFISQLRKHYPNEDIPSYDVVDRTKDSLTIIYSSQRWLYKFAVAFIERAFKYFKLEANIGTELLLDNGTKVRFIISQRAD